jgi:hypothetical protein
LKKNAVARPQGRVFDKQVAAQREIQDDERIYVEGLRDSNAAAQHQQPAQPAEKKSPPPLELLRPKRELPTAANSLAEEVLRAKAKKDQNLHLKLAVPEVSQKKKGWFKK